MNKSKQQYGLTKPEAKSLVLSIEKRSPTIFNDVVVMLSKQAYQVLGFECPKKCLRVYNKNLSESYIAVLLSAAKIYLKLDSNLTYINVVSESCFRPLHGVTDQYAQTVWVKVIEDFDAEKFKRIKVAHITAAMQRLNEIEINKPVIKSCAFDSETQCKVTKYAKLISKNKVFSDITNKSEWLQLANLIHQQLQSFCPLPGEVLFEAVPKKTGV